ncbi:MAG: hypothetical protein NTW21_01355 [Verrucomicrobia bacterium]|nr:hypothetical protein [Verrucomicrobiota bacterium]
MKTTKIIKPLGNSLKPLALGAGILAALLLGVPSAWASTASVSGKWDDPATWGGADVPTSVDPVIINSGITVNVPAGVAAECTDLTVGGAATSIILDDATSSLVASGNVLVDRPNVTGNINQINVGAGTFSAGSLVLGSTASTTGSTRKTDLLIATGTATITGNLTTYADAARITISGAGILSVGGLFTWTVSAPTFTLAAGSTVNYSGAAQPIAATAQSYYAGDDRTPVHAIDGSGMTPNSPVITSSTCGIGPSGNMWLSNGIQDTWITFDLGSVQTIAGFHLWNYNENSSPGEYRRGVKTAGIYAGTSLPADGSSYAAAGPDWVGGTLVENMTLTMAPGTTGYAGEDYTFTTPVTTRYLQIYVTSNFGFDNYTGISEIRFIPAARILSFGSNIAGSSAVIDPVVGGAANIVWTVPYAPYGEAGGAALVAALAPEFTLSSGTCTDQTSGVAPVSPAFPGPVTYTVTDATPPGITNTYTVTATVTPASTACDITAFNANFPGSSATISTLTDTTGTVVVHVPYGTAEEQVAALAPSYTLSPFATPPVVNPVLSLTTPAVYTVTAQSGATKDYTVTVVANASVTYDLGDHGDSATWTTVPPGKDAMLPWIAKGSLSTDSFLRSLSVNVTLEARAGGDTSRNADEIVAYVDDLAGGPGLLQVGGYWPIDPNPPGIYTDVCLFTAFGTGWAKTDGVGGKAVDTKTSAVNWPSLGDVDLGTCQLSIGNLSYVMAWSGTMTVEYDGAGNDIVTFGLPGNPAAFTGGNTIALTVPWTIGQGPFAPSFKMSDGATCQVNTQPVVSGLTLINFTEPVVYTVTPQGGGTPKDYTVTVTVDPASPACDMLTFNANLAGSSAIITTSPTAGTVVVSVPLGTTEAEVAALAPSYTLSAFATCPRPNPGVPTPALSLTTPVDYLVTAEDTGVSKTYTVTVIVSPWTFSAWTGDADSGITSASPYTVAVNCNGAAVSVNGVAFEAHALSGANFSIGGDAYGWGPDGAPNVTGDSLTLANSFIYGGNPRTVTLTNLTPGATYETSLFAFGFDADPVRSQTFASGSDSRVLDQDLYGQNNGIRIAYTFVADSSGEKGLTITPVDGGYTFHLSALANRMVVATPYATWAIANGIPGEPPTGDFDNDGLTNLMEYALGKDPKLSSQPAGELSGKVITFTKGAEAIANGDVSWVIEQSLDLGLIDPWTDVVTQAAGNPDATISYTLPDGVLGGKVFARLAVTMP